MDYQLIDNERDLICDSVRHYSVKNWLKVYRNIYQISTIDGMCLRSSGALFASLVRQNSMSECFLANRKRLKNSCHTNPKIYGHRFNDFGPKTTFSFASLAFNRVMQTNRIKKIYICFHPFLRIKGYSYLFWIYLNEEKQ